MRGRVRVRVRVRLRVRLRMRFRLKVRGRLDLGAEAPAARSSLGRYSQKLMSSGTGNSAATRSRGPKPPG